MSGLGQWLLQDKQKDLFEYLFAVVFNLVFVAVAALALWALGSAALALELARGYGVFWIALLAAVALTLAVQRIFRLDVDSNFDAYVISALVVSALVQIGWCAFAAIAVEPYAAASSAWAAALIHLLGSLSCYTAFVAVSTFYKGTLYRLVNLGVALLGYVFFSVWPTAAHAIYG